MGTHLRLALAVMGLVLVGFGVGVADAGERGAELPRRENDRRDGRGGRPRNPVMLALDADGDGEVSAQEIAGATAALKKLDKDGDGELSRDEMRPSDGRQDADRPARPEPRPRTETPATQPKAVQRPTPVDGFVLVPGGEFEMGDHHNLGGQEHRTDEEPVHKVRVSSFHMATTETANEQYCAFLNAALAERVVGVRNGLVGGKGTATVYCDTYGSDQASGIEHTDGRFVVREGRGNHPVVCIRWHGAVAYCNWLSSEKGLDPCYDLKTGACDFSKNGFRLPTEAEWEYAGRGGQYGPYFIFPWGNEPDNARANWPNSGDPFETGPLPHTTPVGFYCGKRHRKADVAWPGRQETYQTKDGANAYGLHDMSGNAWEWVYDWYRRDTYANSPAADPHGPETGQPMRDGKPYRVLRSGSWYNGQWGHGRVANRNPSYYRGPDDPDHRWYHIGFRVARNATHEGQTVAANRTVGLFLNTPKACPGYTLFAPKHNHTIYLINNDGQIVNSWKSEYEPGQSVYLLPNGHLLHCCFARNRGFTRGGEGGRIEEFDWEGNLVWEFTYSSDQHLSHHDIEPLPSGNILVLAVEKKSYEECIAAGFNPRNLRDRQLFPEHIIEIQPTRPKGAKIVWEWHVWDHLVQNNDRTKANFGDPAAHPELIDVDCNGRAVPAFWNHANSIAYSPELDQIVLSARGCNEIWVIDHGTTTAEAKGHTGGRRGKGGDLVYRWGNPAAYGRGTRDDRQLFQQHDAQWVPDGYPGAGNLVIFNNGLDRGWSTIVEIAPPVDAKGNYTIEHGKAFGPAKPAWVYQAANRKDFYSSEISGAHRLPNGNTLICAGVHGTFFEVTPEGETVWKYVNAMVRNGILAQGEKAGTDHRGHYWNAVFKIHRYPPDYPGLKDRDLTPKGVVELPASQKGKTGLDGWSEPRRDPGRRPGGDSGRSTRDRGKRGGRR